MEFAENLKYLRTTRQLTQKELAKTLGLSANCVCEWEKNRSEPSLSTIKKLADLFEVSTDYLLGLEDDFGTRITVPVSASTQADELTEKQKALLDAFGKLLPETQDFLLLTAQSLCVDANPKKLK